MNLKCPHCNSEGIADDVVAGSYVLCFECGKRFIARFTDKLVRMQVKNSASENVVNLFNPEDAKQGEPVVEESLKQNLELAESFNNSFTEPDIATGELIESRSLLSDLFDDEDVEEVQQDDLVVEGLDNMELTDAPEAMLAAAVVDENLNSILDSPVEENDVEIVEEDSSLPLAAIGTVATAVVSMERTNAAESEVEAITKTVPEVVSEPVKSVKIPKKIEVRCPECTTEGHVPSNFYGKKIRCPRCNFKFIAGDDVESEVAAALSIAASPVKKIEKAKRRTEQTTAAPAVKIVEDSEGTSLTDSLFGDSLGTVARNAEESSQHTAQSIAELEGDITSKLDELIQSEVVPAPSLQNNVNSPNSEELFDTAPSSTMTESLARAARVAEKGAEKIKTSQAEANVIADSFLNQEKTLLQKESLLRNAPSFSIIEICKEALSWSFNLSFSWRCWAVWGIVMFCAVLVSMGIEFILGVAFKSIAAESQIIITFASLVSIFVGTALFVPFNSGMQYFSTRYLVDGDADISTSLAWIKNACCGKLCKMGFLQTLLIFIGYILLVLPGIYLQIAYIFAGILVIDRGLGAWEALEVSRKALNKKIWFKVFGALLLVNLPMILIVLFTTVMVSFILSTGGGLALVLGFGVLGLGAMGLMLLTLPAYLATVALLYREIFKPSQEPIDSFF